MRNQWVTKNVNLEVLTQRVKHFFESDFKVAVENVQGGIMIEAMSKIPNVRLKITVKIYGEPNDFTVEFLTGKKQGFFSASMIIGYLTSMFGGGYLISREAKKREFLDLLENDFWKHTQIQVADLANSAALKKDETKRYNQLNI